jgi:Tol biopolymer transport system component
MDELDLFRNFRRGVATPGADAQRRASTRLASALDVVVGREKAARLRQGRRRWPLVAIAVAIVAGMALLATPALGIGDRLLSLIQSRPTPLDVQAPSWSRDGGTIVFVSWRDGNGEVYAMDADGTSPRNLTQNPAKDVRPAWSPDGRRIAFVSRRDGNSEVYVMDADGSGRRNLTRNRASDDYPTWSRDGRRIAFFRARLVGSRTNPNCHCREEVYDTGLYVMNADGSGLRRLSLRVPEGTPETTGTQKGKADQLVWSPDGRTIYFGRYLVRTDGSGARRLAYFPLTGWSGAVWSPDGTRIAFKAKSPGPPPTSTSPSHTDIYVMNADGSGKRRLTHDARQNAEPAWSPDGRKIAFVSGRDGNAEIYVMNADGSGKRNLTRNPARDRSPSWSPDGRRIAFVSNRDGRLEAHVMNADGSGQRSLTQRDG